MDLGDGLGHLSYSTLVHAGDTWEQMRASLEEFVPRVKQRVSPDAPFAVSLRMSAATVETLRSSPAERVDLRAFLDANDLYLYTVNAFPYGPFKGRRVMEDVYEPDWSTEERIAYTIGVAELLAELTPPSIDPSIQSAPLAFAANVARRSGHRSAHHQHAAGRGPSARPRATHRPAGEARARARAGLLPGDHG